MIPKFNDEGRCPLCPVAVGTKPYEGPASHCNGRCIVRGAFHNMEMKPRVVAMGSLIKPDEYARTSPDRRKTVKGEDGCMPGKGGKCVLCGTGDCLRRSE